MSRGRTYYAIIAENGDIQCVGTLDHHELLDVHMGAGGMTAIDEEHAKAIGMHPERWRFEGRRLVPRPPNLPALALDARRRRFQLLNVTDWTTVADAPLSDAKRAEWRTYRQALRDLPEQPGFPTEIAWPKPPAKQEKST